MFSYLGLNEYLSFLNAGFKNATEPKQIATVNKNVIPKDIKPKVEKPAIAAQSPSVPPKEEAKLQEPKNVVQQPVKPVVVQPKSTTVQQPATIQQTQPKVEPSQPTIQPIEDNVPLFKNLYAFRANEPHYVAISVLNGVFEFDKVKLGFDAFNAKNYGILNLKVTKDTFEKQQFI
jgi:hypothetical protein